MTLQPEERRPSRPRGTRVRRVATAGHAIHRVERSHTMSLRINDVVPDFEADTSQGPIRFHEWIGDSWAILFSHPKDFTPVCTTEFGAVARLAEEWKKRGTKVIGISVDGVEEHKQWIGDIETYAGNDVEFPIIADEDLKVAKLFDMLPADAYLPDGRTPDDSATVRAVFIIGPDKKDRKSTRLNSSHVRISYAVFCLKKKKHLYTDVLSV